MSRDLYTFVREDGTIGYRKCVFCLRPTKTENEITHGYHDACRAEDINNGENYDPRND